MAPRSVTQEMFSKQQWEWHWLVSFKRHILRDIFWLQAFKKAWSQNMSAAQVLNSLVRMRGYLTVVVIIHPVGKVNFQLCKNRTEWKCGFHLLSKQRNYTLLAHRSTLFSFSCKIHLLTTVDSLRYSFTQLAR